MNRNMKCEVYMKECLKMLFMPMMKKHDDPPVFWPDLGSYNYSRSVIKWYQQNGIDFFPKTWIQQIWHNFTQLKNFGQT